VTGLHGVTTDQLAYWQNNNLWHFEVDWSQPTLFGEDKFVASRARITTRIDAWNETTRCQLAVDFAEHVLPFYERQYPNDDRIRNAIVMARRYTLGEISHDQLDNAISAAVTANAAAATAAHTAACVAAAAATPAASYSYATTAANIAIAAARAAAQAAVHAARAASYAYATTAAAAADAARATTAYADATTHTAAHTATTAVDGYAIERRWQSRRIAEVLGLPLEE
jgi:hypothetical protein